jgi:hypothetical protein
MLRHYVLDGDGQPLECDDLLVWASWMQTANRHVAQDTTGDVTVSTVFLGLDHNFGERRAGPVLWETMVFGGPCDQEQHRYRSRADAEAGHRAVWHKVREVIA